MIAMDLVQPQDRQTLNPALRDQVVQKAFRQGLLLLGCGESAIRFCPPLCITAQQVEKALEVLGGLLARRAAEALAR